MNIYTIYRATNTINGKCYIGFDSKWPNRMNAHRKASFNEKASDYNTHFHRAIRKHGWDAFVWEILYAHYDGHYTKNEMESHYITENDSYNNGYNMTLGGEGTIGLKYTEERRAKLSKALKGKYQPPLSDDHKMKISHFMKTIGNSGQFKSGDKRIQEGTRKASVSNKGRRWWHNHKEEIKSFEQPGPEWINGRLPQNRPPSRKGIPSWNKGKKLVKT